MIPSRPSYVSGAPRAFVLQALLAVHILAAAGALALALLAPESSREGLGEAAAGTATQVRGLLDMARWSTFLGLAFAFPLWFHRAYKNLVAFRGREGLRSSPAWAWLSFWVPFVNVWRPFQIGQEIYAKSGSDDEILASSRDIGCWWVTWLVGGILSRYSDKLSSVLLVASAVFAIRMVRSIEGRQARRATLADAAVPA
jgi:hypothetical protein